MSFIDIDAIIYVNNTNYFSINIQYKLEA